MGIWSAAGCPGRVLWGYSLFIYSRPVALVAIGLYGRCFGLVGGIKINYVHDVSVGHSGCPDVAMDVANTGSHAQIPMGGLSLLGPCCECSDHSM